MLTTVIGLHRDPVQLERHRNPAQGILRRFLLLLQTAMLGVFMSLDMLLFFVFWELTLVPMYFIIAIWGGQRRAYAAIKFIIYTLIGSVLMFLGILTLYYQHYLQFQNYSFDLADLMRTSLSPSLQWWVFWAFFVGFAVKVPMFPFHTWLPDAHTEAPTAGSVILAAVLLKMGTYGFLRFSLAAAAGFRQEPDHRQHHGGALHHRHRLRRAGLPDAEGLEKAGRLFVGQPPGILHAGHFRPKSRGHFRLHHPADQPRHLHRHALPDCRRGLRAAPHARDLRVRRPDEGHADLHHRLPDRVAEFAGDAGAQRLHRRDHHPARRLPDVFQLGLLGERSGSRWARPT